MGSVTVVIPTHDRYQKLRALLQSIRGHPFSQLDAVIVVDDSTSPREVQSEFEDIRVRQIVLPRRAFISRSKNLGWKAAETEFVYFIDDDNVLDDTTLQGVYEVMLKSERNGAVSPAVLYKSRPDLVWVYATPFRNSRLEHNLLGRNLPRDPSLENRLIDTDALPNASLIRRAALEEIGGFDENLVVNSSMDLAIKLKARGWRVMSDTGAFIYHDVPPPGEFGWWAAHGSVDPERVRYEIRDWFLMMRRLHRDDSLIVPKAVLESSKFVLPNMLSYLLRGTQKVRTVKGMALGYSEGLFRDDGDAR